MGAAAIVLLTPRVIIRLPLWAEHLNIHGRVESAKDLLPLVSSPLVTGVDGAGLPVRPVQGVSRERQGKGVCQTALHDLLPEGAVQVGTVDEAELGVGPVQLLLLQVNGQPVGPVNVRVHDDLPGAAIHPCPLDPRRLSPVCPVHIPVRGVQGDGPRLVKVLPEEDLPGRPIEVGHLDAVGLRVCPVQLLADPVAGQAIG